MKVAIDGMGGDHAPQAIIAGVILAARELSELEEVVIIGPHDIIEKELSIPTTSPSGSFPSR